MLTMSPMSLGYTTTPAGSAQGATPQERATFERLQRALNAFTRKFMPSVGTIRVDGVIGRQTLALRNTAYARAAAYTGAPFIPRKTIDELANAALVDAMFVEAATAAVPKQTLPKTTEEIAPPTPGIPETPFVPPVPPAPPPEEGIPGWVIGGGLFLGFAALLATVYALRKRSE